MGRAVVIVVDQHPGPIEVLTGWPNAQHLSILEPNLFAQDIFRGPCPFSPYPARIVQLGPALMDKEGDGLRRGSLDDESVITGGLEVCPPKSARGSSAQRIARERTEIDRRCFGPAWRQTGTGQRAGHDDDAVFRTERFGIKRQLFKKKVGRERLSPNELFQDGFFGQILNPDGA